MPVPGPRTQARPLPGYSNPGNEQPHRFNLWERPPPVARVGETPAVQYINRRGNVLAVGQIRQLWRQVVGFIGAPAPYSWTGNAPNPGQPSVSPRGFQITRALRYLTRSYYAPAGADNTRFAGLHTRIQPKARSKPVTLGAGLTRSRPTVRNRMTSFGSRVPPINHPVPAADQGGMHR